MIIPPEPNTSARASGRIRVGGRGRHDQVGMAPRGGGDQHGIDLVAPIVAMRT
ncbi:MULTISPECIES: hypothetical protein [unclassified Rhodococcus (in: high G+C Gram-positive bacteria)]|uniref:hypothetical protein n=1 Tax=unclassified Rhodococcus (in: high G+C Gram-positive bacteria) TaxID=192944 RepID=UPI001639F708|nr:MULTISPECIES: hypothetical protein [unclassified Rhodococcus (in: high G+C Gram-positive bacteria)]MBC2642592.1 hypothetical protein [Rhodococcus sp. 3A]MBC2892666.1 hypothetical protein [Rhodococcus sp. 4CII]